CRSTSKPVIVSILISATTTCGAMLSSCSIAFAAELNGKTCWPFSRQRVTMTSTMAGSSSMIMILAIKSQRGEYFRFEKKKAEMRIALSYLGAGTSIDHRPGHDFIERDNLLENIAPAFQRNRDQVRQSTRNDPPQE